MPEKTKLAWLAGLVDGDGSITVFKNYEKNSRVTKLCPAIVIVNTNPNIINEVMKLADQLGVSFHLFERKAEKREWKNALQLTTRNFGYIQKFLEAILPYLVGKRSQAELVLRLVHKRIEIMKETGRNNHIPYDESDYQLETEIRKLNKRGPNSSTTKRSAPTGDDIV